MPRTLKVESRNQWFQRVETLLRNRTKRHREGLFVVEGVRSVNALVSSRDWRIEAFLYTPAESLSRWAHQTLDEADYTFRLELSPDLMAELSDKEELSELLAVARIPEDDPARLPPRPDALYLLIDRPVLPGNLGTLIRSCDGLGAHGLAMFGHGADLYDPRTVRSSAGSLFELPVVRFDAWEDLSAWMERLRAADPPASVVATSARDGVLPEEVDLAGPLVLLMGNETSGLSHALAETADVRLTLPMAGSASSLNVACAATALLAEVGRQRRGCVGWDPPGHRSI